MVAVFSAAAAAEALAAGRTAGLGAGFGAGLAAGFAAGLEAVCDSANGVDKAVAASTSRSGVSFIGRGRNGSIAAGRR
jgi:hypothetical protein